MQQKTLLSNILRLSYCNIVRFTSGYCYKNISKWKGIKGKYKGKRCFLIANGPSLNMTPLYLLKDEYTIMFNRAGLMIERLNYVPSFYMIADGLVGRNIKNEISYYVEKCEHVFVPDINKGELVKFTDFVPFEENVLYMYEEPKKFSHTLPFMNGGGTVIYPAFQVLMYLGFDEIIVVGNDMNYVVHKTVEVLSEEKNSKGVYQNIRSKEDDDPNHFDPRYFGKGKEYHQPTEVIMKKMLASLDRVAREYKKAGVNIVNAGYNSMVKSFPKQEFYEALGYTQKKIDELFNDLVKSKGLPSMDWTLGKAIIKEHEWDESLDIVGVPMEKATEIVKKKIIDYLPLGPYKGVVYFVNRKIINVEE